MGRAIVTKTDDAKRLEKLAKLIPFMREEWEKLGAMLDEFDALTGGKAAIADRLKEVETGWAELWSSIHKEPWVWPDYARSRGQIKTLFRKGLSVRQILSRASVYITGDNEYYLRRKHPWDLFVATINEHVRAGGDGDLAERPSGCKHDPPCKDQFEHTKKRQADLTT